LKLPPALRSKPKRPMEGDSSDDDGVSHLKGSGDSDTWATKSWKTGKKNRRGNEEDLSYEGRTCLSDTEQALY